MKLDQVLYHRLRSNRRTARGQELPFCLLHNREVTIKCPNRIFAEACQFNYPSWVSSHHPTSLWSCGCLWDGHWGITSLQASDSILVSLTPASKHSTTQDRTGYNREAGSRQRLTRNRRFRLIYPVRWAFSCYRFVSTACPGGGGLSSLLVGIIPQYFCEPRMRSLTITTHMKQTHFYRTKLA